MDLLEKRFVSTKKYSFIEEMGERLGQEFRDLLKFIEDHPAQETDNSIDQVSRKFVSSNFLLNVWLKKRFKASIYPIAPFAEHKVGFYKGQIDREIDGHEKTYHLILDEEFNVIVEFEDPEISRLHVYDTYENGFTLAIRRKGGYEYAYAINEKGEILPPPPKQEWGGIP